MEFDLSSEQYALRDAAAALLDRYASRDRVRAHVGDGAVVGGSPGTRETVTGYDDALWSAMADQGWLGVEVPETEGGLGLGMAEVAVLCEQLGRHVAPAPFMPTVLALDALAGAETDLADISKWRSGLISGEQVACVGWSGRADAARVEELNDGTSRLTGRLDPAVYAPSAEVAIVVAADELFAVGLDADVRPAPEPAMDRTRELGWLDLKEVPAIRLGGADAVSRLTDRAATATSAELLGVAEYALEMAVEYAKDRVQFGKPIGSFQAVKHKLADALVDVEGMRSTVYYAAWCTSSGDDDESLAASMAKAWCSDAGRRVLAAALQVHGGIGFTWEHDLHLYLRRAKVNEMLYGAPAEHYERLVTLLD